MSDDDVSMMTQPASKTYDSTQVSAGNMLRVARESAGLHIGALAVSLKVPVKKLEALEAGRIDLLPDAVFARALASSICRTLKIDSGPVLMNLPQVTRSRLAPETTGEKGSYRPAGRGASHPQLLDLPKPFVLVGMVLVIAALLVAFYPVNDKSANALSKAPGAPVGVEVPVQTPPATPVAPAQSVVDQPVNAVLELTKTATSGSILSTVPAGVADDAGLLVFKSSATAWVEVVDAAKVVHLRRALVAGESVAVSGTLPLFVIVGKADSIEVRVRGKAFDLTPVAKDNVARFEVR